ncbi:MAG: UMP kinase [Gammaproteobacteria bacterium]|nr:UMP kinase [Gammaproteobacteria bacterium]
MSNLRILLKLSGEALTRGRSRGIDIEAVERLVGEIRAVRAAGVEIAIVIGGGNIVRGGDFAATGMDRVAADQMGMLATVINALALQQALERQDIHTRVMSAVEIKQVCESYIRRRAVRHLEKGRVVVFAAGTGNPFFTTDSAASLRAVEIGAGLLLKATKVDGVYDADPGDKPGAERYERLSYDKVLQDRLEFMDATAIVMCRDHRIPIRIFNMNEPGALGRIVGGEPVGTLVAGRGAEDAQ